MKKKNMSNNTLSYYQNNSSLLVKRYESADVSEVQKLLLQVFPRDARLLEIGCGSGRDAAFLVENNYDVIAIDGSQNMIEAAKKVHSNLADRLFYRVLPSELNFDNKFNGVYSIATLMHLSKKELVETLSKVYEILEDGGLFVMSVSLERDDVDDLGIDSKGRFFLIMTQDEWINICQNSGFKIEIVQRNNDGLNRSGIEWLSLVVKK